MASNQSTAQELAECITAEYAEEIKVQQAIISRILESSNFRRSSNADHGSSASHRRKWDSLTEPAIDIHVGVAHYDTTRELTNNVVIFQAIIIGYAKGSASESTVPEVESEAWARAIFGPEWAHFAYKVDYKNRANPLTRRVYPLAVSRSDGPIVAPTGLRWERIVLGDPKLGPPTLTRIDI